MNIVTFEINNTCVYPTGYFLETVLTYVNNIYDNLKIIENIVDTDINIWCTGNSGSILATMLFVKIHEKNKKNIIIYNVRKNNEISHCLDHHDKNYLNCKENVLNIIIDDFIESGKSLSRIVNKMKSFNIVPDVLCLIVDEMFNFKPKQIIYDIGIKNLIVGIYND